MNWITPKNRGFSVSYIGYEDSEYFNKELNLDLVVCLEKLTINNEKFPIFKLNFKTINNDRQLSWYFKEEAERDATYEKILKYVNPQVI